MNRVKAALLIVGTFFGWLLIGVSTGIALCAIMPEDPAFAIGTAVWLLGGFTTLMFGSIYLAGADDFADPPAVPKTRADRRKIKAAGKMQTAEIRVGFVYCLICVGFANMLKAPWWLSTVVGIASLLVGVLVGHCAKRLNLSRSRSVRAAK